MCPTRTNCLPGTSAPIGRGSNVPGPAVGPAGHIQNGSGPSPRRCGRERDRRVGGGPGRAPARARDAQPATEHRDEPGTIGHWASTGRLHRVHLGVFAVGHRALSDRAHLLAAVMACGSGAALSHIHAALLWDLLPPWREVELTPTHVTVPRGSGRGRRPEIVIHRAALPATELRALDRIPICSAARTVLDCAEASSARDFERLVDQAITGDRVTRLELDGDRERASDPTGGRGNPSPSRRG